MKTMLGVMVLAAGVLTACQSDSPASTVDSNSPASPVDAEEKQGLIQVRMDVESEEINQVLQELQDQGNKIIEVIPLDQKEQTGYVDKVYDIIYEAKN